MLYKPHHAVVSAGYYRNHPRYQGCVGHWIFNEGGGGTVYDLSGSRAHGTLTAGPTWSVGQFGGAVNFDGTDDEIQVSDYVYATTALSLSLWVNDAANGRAQSYLAQWSGGQHAFSLSHFSDNKYYLDVAGTGGGDIFFSSTSTYTTDTLGVWRHIVGVYRGTAGATILAMYRDGILIPGSVTGTIPASLFNSNQPIQIGAEGTNSWCQGKIDEVRIYNRVLSSDEIQSLYINPWLEFYTPPRRRGVRLAPSGPPAGSLGLLGVGR